ncbi:MAG: hypothetical protein K8L99_32395 [Anaerolineae bacterium]|nr:hypothetical protein [Anaerolineae bacterium]
MISLPTTGRWTRLLALGYGITLFLWISIEDQAVWPVTLFGLGLAALMTILGTLDKIGGRRIPVWQFVICVTLLGGLIGVGTGIATAGLMFFKNAIHAHLFVDFPPGLMLAILERAPVWGLAGILLGLSIGLVWTSLVNKS